MRSVGQHKNCILFALHEGELNCIIIEDASGKPYIFFVKSAQFFLYWPSIYLVNNALLFFCQFAFLFREK